MILIKLLDYIYYKPFTGFITSISGWFLGSVPINNNFTVSYTQVAILWHLQIASLLIGSIAGILTIISLLRRNNRKSR